MKKKVNTGIAVAGTTAATTAAALGVASYQNYLKTQAETEATKIERTEDGRRCNERLAIESNDCKDHLDELKNLNDEIRTRIEKEKTRIEKQNTILEEKNTILEQENIRLTSVAKSVLTEVFSLKTLPNVKELQGNISDWAKQPTHPLAQLPQLAVLIRGLEAELIRDLESTQACEWGGQWKWAEEILLEHMVASSVKPDVITFNVLISAMGNAGEWERAEEIFHGMGACGIKPEVFTFTLLLKAMGKGGQWKRAKEIFDAMVARGLEPDAFTLSLMKRITTGV
jgi:pentatricopeptide repeat protein